MSPNMILFASLSNKSKQMWKETYWVLVLKCQLFACMQLTSDVLHLVCRTCWLRFGKFRHPALGSYSSGPAAARKVGTKSIGGFNRPDVSPSRTTSPPCLDVDVVFESPMRNSSLSPSPVLLLIPHLASFLPPPFSLLSTLRHSDLECRMVGEGAIWFGKAATAGQAAAANVSIVSWRCLWEPFFKPVILSWVKSLD